MLWAWDIWQVSGRIISPYTCYIRFSKLHNKYFFVCLQLLQISSLFLRELDFGCHNLSSCVSWRGKDLTVPFYLNGSWLILWTHFHLIKNLVLNSFHFQNVSSVQWLYVSRDVINLTVWFKNLNLKRTFVSPAHVSFSDSYFVQLDITFDLISNTFKPYIKLGNDSTIC